MFKNHWFCNAAFAWNHFMYFWSGVISNFAYNTLGFLHAYKSVFQSNLFCHVSFQWNNLIYFWSSFIFKLCLQNLRIVACIKKGVPKPLFVFNVFVKWSHCMEFWNCFMSKFAYQTWGGLTVLKRVFQNHWFRIVFF